MPRPAFWFIIPVVLAASSSAWAEFGFNLLYKSNGEADIVGWKLTDNGFAGTYITLAAPGQVTLTVNAHGTAADSIDPHMNLVIGDEKVGWDVGASAANYQHTFDLPAGTHLVRTEFNNDVYTAAGGGTARSLTINTLDVTGATISNGSGATANTNALAAADTYVANNRKGDATLYMPAIEEGTPIQVKLKHHEFNFGIGVPGSSVVIDSPPPGSTAALFQQAVADNRFSSMTAGSSGKWASNEFFRDTNSMGAVEAIGNYAAEHGMRYRAHNLIWGPSATTGAANQQPSWAHTMLQNPDGIDGVSGDVNSVALRDEISERIQYYVADEAGLFYDIDVYNESYHTGSDHTQAALSYWEVYGVDGVAGIYKEVKDALTTAGATARLSVNEYNVLQGTGSNFYADWYMRHIEDLQNTGRTLYGEDVVTGIGFQYYNNGSASSHNASRIYAVMSNLAVQGLPFALTEWGVTDGTVANAAFVLDQTARLVFGMPGAVGMTLWDLRTTGAFAPVGALYNGDWTTRDTYDAWQALMAAWDTDMSVNVNPDGTIDFNGFYGDYEITIGSQTYDLTLSKDGENQFLLYDYTIPGDTDGDGDADIDDLVAIKNHMGDTGVGFGMGDTDGDGDVDNTDLQNVKDNFGMSVTPGPPPGLTFVPEPASLGLLSVCGLMLVLRVGGGIEAVRDHDDGSESEKVTATATDD